MFPNKYDVIVVGAGHAGSEAAAAAANLGSKTLLITMNLQNIAQMSCNPAMGGIAKGQIIREIDALGGYSGIVSDKTAIQFKMLNKSKGPAMWSPRVQSDRMRFSETWRDLLENTSNLDFYQEMVSGLLVENNVIVGVKTSLGLEIRSKSVILTNGTFLNDQRILEPMQLRDGDQIKVGDVQFVFHDPEVTYQDTMLPELEMDISAGLVRVNRQLVELAPKEFELLAYLYSQPGLVCSKDAIGTAVWPEYQDSVYDYQIENLVRRLRTKLEPDPTNPQLLLTVRGRGYKLVL